MMFEWDSNKNALNLNKHGLSFEEAIHIFNGPVFTTEDSRRDYGENRSISIGALSRVIVVVVVHTNRGEKVRVISARKANRKERRLYHEYLKEKA